MRSELFSSHPGVSVFVFAFDFWNNSRAINSECIPTLADSNDVHCQRGDMNCHVAQGYFTTAVNELLGKYICSILPARRESDTFPARRERQEFFPLEGLTLVCLAKKEGVKKKRKKENFPGKAEAFGIDGYYSIWPLLVSFSLFYVSQEESVFRTDISKNSCRWLLSLRCSCKRWNVTFMMKRGIEKKLNAFKCVWKSFN